MKARAKIPEKWTPKESLWWWLPLPARISGKNLHPPAFVIASFYLSKARTEWLTDRIIVIKGIIQMKLTQVKPELMKEIEQELINSEIIMGSKSKVNPKQGLWCLGSNTPDDCKGLSIVKACHVVCSNHNLHVSSGYIFPPDLLDIIFCFRVLHRSIWRFLVKAQIIL